MTEEKSSPTALPPPGRTWSQYSFCEGKEYRKTFSLIGASPCLSKETITVLLELREFSWIYLQPIHDQLGKAQDMSFPSELTNL
jgi:hypothetical protein